MTKPKPPNPEGRLETAKYVSHTLQLAASESTGQDSSFSLASTDAVVVQRKTNAFGVVLNINTKQYSLTPEGVGNASLISEAHRLQTDEASVPQLLPCYLEGSFLRADYHAVCTAGRQ